MIDPLGGGLPTEELMTVTPAHRDGHPVLAVRGEIDLSTGDQLRATVSNALQEGGSRPVILDLSAVEFLSFSGLGQLVALDREARSLTRRLLIVIDHTDLVARPITAMRLDEVLSLFQTIDEALLD